MTAVEGERAVGPLIDDQAAGPAEQAGSPAEEARPRPDGAAGPAAVADPTLASDERPPTDGAGATPPADDPGDGAADSPADAADSPADAADSPADAADSPADAADSPAGDPADSSTDAIASPPPEEAPPPLEPGRDEPPAPPVPVAPPEPGRRRRVVLAAVLVALLLTIGGGLVGAWAALALRPVPPAATAAAVDGLADAVAAVSPAVLSIQSGAPDTGNVGTALIVTPTGDVVTNEHLVHGESTATLIHADGRTDTARVVAADEEADLAWLRIDGAQGLPVVRLAGPAAVRPGEDVVAIGNALNLEGPPSVTRGIVSAVGRSTATLTDVIQTDAAISSGSSGGALVDSSGTVVGITTEALVGDPSVSVEDIAFAIPADRVATVLRGMGLVLPD